LNVKAKKHLGQHFLTDENIAKKIVEGLDFQPYQYVLEVGPGTGVLTKYLLEKPTETYVAEIDTESIEYLKLHYQKLENKHFTGDFLKINLSDVFSGEVAVIGNFPYNISSQILFKIIENYQQIPEMVGMFQKEVAERTAAVPRTKDYGILSVLVQIQESTLKKQGKEITTEEHNALVEKITQNYTKQTKVEYSAARIWVDAIINPLDTRKWISAGIELANHSPITDKYNLGVIQV
jgi:phospholipid N-methyltransferase